MSLLTDEMATQVAQTTCCHLDDARDDVSFTRNVEQSVDRFLDGTFLSGVSRNNPETKRTILPTDRDVIMIDDSPVRVLEPSMKADGPGKRISGYSSNLLESVEQVSAGIDPDNVDDINVSYGPLLIRNQQSLVHFSQTLDIQGDTQPISSPPITQPRRRDNKPDDTTDVLRQKPRSQGYELMHEIDSDDDIITISDTSASSASYSARTIQPCSTPADKCSTKRRRLEDSTDDDDDPTDGDTDGDLDVPDVHSFFDKFDTVVARESSTGLLVPAKPSFLSSYASGTKSTSGILASIAASKQAHKAASEILPKSYTNIEVEDLIDTSSSSPVGNANSVLLKRKQNDIDNIPTTRHYSANTRSILERLDSFNVDKFTQEYKKNQADKGTQNTVAHRFTSEEESTVRSKAKRRNQQENTGSKRKQSSEGVLIAKKKAAREKEAEREQKRKEKEQISLEKQRQNELAAVNRLKLSKKDTCAEMIVDIDADFANTAGGQKLQYILAPLGIEVSTSWTSPTRNTIKWRRKVKAEYNDALGHFVPIPEEVRKESFILTVLTGVEFVDMVIENRLIDKVTSIRRIYPDLKLIYMIEGLTSFFKKMTARTQREFSNMVQDALGNSTSKTKKRNEEGDLFVKVQRAYNHRLHLDLVEDALIMLQVEYDCLVFHSTTPLDSAEWISILTQDIGTIPYKKSRLNIHESICMESGQVKAGTTNKDTFSQTLHQVKYVTPSLSKGISDKYGTINDMMKALDIGGSNVFLAIGGEASNRKIGQTLAKNLSFVFSSTDPNAFVP
ncbi:uncharacterized protein V1513DRAFT_437606 [Lipomyces chichibuensis]|uniref:uncharacterized protein n=1 Tax=Lipomyces chichibuensis TaxID=1546026 RepID=UPI003343E3CD